MIQKKRGFTLIELVATLAISGIVFALIATVIPAVYKTNNTATYLSKAQISAQMTLARLEDQLGYASVLDIETSPPSTLSSGNNYICISSGAIVKKVSGVSDEAISLEFGSPGYSYDVNFKQVNTKVIEVVLYVLKNNVQVYSISSKVFANNLFSGTITGTAQGKYLCYQLSAVPVVNVSSITITSSSNFITTNGATLQLNTIVLPRDATNKAVSWSIDNSDLALLSQTGLLTPLKNGTVTITATSLDGLGVLGTKQITISNQNVTITNLTLTTNTGAVYVIKGGNKLTIIPNITPSDATNKTITWSIDNTAYATIDNNGVLTSGYTHNKSVIVTASTNDGTGIKETIEIRIVF